MSNWDFALAIDIGNSRVVSAVARVAQSAQTIATVFSSGNEEHSAASAVFADSDGSLHFADDAERLGRERPERLVREFAHQIGDDVPVMIGEHAIRAEDLYAAMCTSIVSAVTASEGAPPAVIAITVPTSWGGHRRALISAALERAGIADAILLSEAEAAARHYEISHPLEPGKMLGIYDLGGTKFDALVLRKRIAAGVGSQPIGEQISIDDLGGADFDELLLRQVMTTADATADATSDTTADATALGAGDNAKMQALAALRREVVKAKETLSFEADATLPIQLPSGSATVRINRSEFEALIDEPLERTLDALDLAIESAGIEVNRLEAILLTGGSSRIPLVAQRLSERFDRPLVAEVDPKATVALGAAHIAWDRLQSGFAPRSAVVPVGDAVAVKDAVAVESGASAADSPTGALQIQRPPEKKSWWPKSPILLTTAAAFIAFAIVFSNTTAAGSRWPDYVQDMANETASLVDPLFLGDFAPKHPTSKDSAEEAAVPTVPKTPVERASDQNVSRERNASRERNVTRDSAPVARSRGISDATADAPRNTSPKSPTKSGPQVEPSGPPVDDTPTAPVAETPVDTPDPVDTTPPTVTPDPVETAPPATDPPATDPPATDPPATDPPATDPPATDSPATDPTPTTPPADPPATTTSTADPPPTEPAPTEPAPADPAPADTAGPTPAPVP